jgi:hypothetical protein
MHAYDQYMQTVANPGSTRKLVLLGPTQCATGLGRLNTAIDANSSVIYVGSSNGGYEINNGGASWSMSHQCSLLSIADIKVSPSD